MVGEIYGLKIAIALNDDRLSNYVSFCVLIGKKQATQEGWLVFWAHKDLNLGPTDYESVALTN